MSQSHLVEKILTSRELCDLELIMNGAYKPLEGFMTWSQYNSVVEELSLNDNLFPLPVTLTISYQEHTLLDKTILLKDKNNLPLAKLEVQDVYKPDLEKECLKVYGTLDTNHPSVKRLLSNKDIYYVGGKVHKINDVLHYDFNDLRLNPKQIKEKKISPLVAFQTRNPMHRSHYELTMLALKEVPGAKLLLHPIVGPSQDCDVNYRIRVRCYKKILKYYPSDKVILSLLPYHMRMAGPREALMHAIIRRNYGCTHFIIGRDHAAPSYKTKEGIPFYSPYQAHELALKYKDKLGINIIIQKDITYVVELDKYLPINRVSNNMKTLFLSGTELRKKLQNKEELPPWFSFPEIAEELQKAYSKESGLCIYLIGLSGSGKTTTAKALKSKLLELQSRPVTILDGDNLRNKLGRLSFSKEDRSLNVRRMGYIASKIVKHSGLVICANIAPYQDDRSYNREVISKVGNYLEVYIKTPIEICEKRDIKGLYSKARKGEIKNFTGINDPFEVPVSDIVINGDNNLTNNVAQIVEEIIKRKYLLI